LAARWFFISMLFGKIFYEIHLEASRHFFTLVPFTRNRPPPGGGHDCPSYELTTRWLFEELVIDMVYNVSSMTEVINESLFAERSLGLLSLAFGVLATLLSIVGLYDVMSYSVARRYREIGIRMALGARPGLVLRMVLSES